MKSEMMSRLKTLKGKSLITILLINVLILICLITSYLILTNYFYMIDYEFQYRSSYPDFDFETGEQIEYNMGWEIKFLMILSLILIIENLFNLAYQFYINKKLFKP